MKKSQLDQSAKKALRTLDEIVFVFLFGTSYFLLRNCLTAYFFLEPLTAYYHFILLHIFATPVPASIIVLIILVHFFWF